MNQQNLSYAIVQIIHNFGAVLVAISALLALFNNFKNSLLHQKKLAWMILTGWGIQGASGAMFGVVSFYFQGQFPDIHSLALVALIVKILCTAIGFCLATFYLLSCSRWKESRRRLTWKIMATLFSVALISAALLRWFA